nr:MAG TPA: hypothetical protein [Microviridae sp.]
MKRKKIRLAFSVQKLLTVRARLRARIVGQFLTEVDKWIFSLYLIFAIF